MKRFCFINKVFGEKNDLRQFILSGASLPKKIKKQETKVAVDQWFKNPIWIKSSNFHKIPERIELKSIQIDELEEEKNFSIVQELLKQKEKTIVFCQQQETVKKLHQYLVQQGVPAEAFYASKEIGPGSERKLVRLIAFFF